MRHPLSYPYTKLCPQGFTRALAVARSKSAMALTRGDMARHRSYGAAADRLVMAAYIRDMGEDAERAAALLMGRGGWPCEAAS